MARDWNRVLDAVLDGVVVLDEAGRVERLNAEAHRILQTSTQAASGRPVEHLPGAEAFAEAARGALSLGSSQIENEIELPRRFGRPLVVDVAASPLLDASGRVEGGVLLLRDRTIGTALREAERERSETAAFGRIAAGIAHEVKNPLGGIRGAAELMAGGADDPRTRERAQLIVRESDRITALLDDFLTFARGERLRLAPVNLHRVLDDVLDLLADDPLGARATVGRFFDPSLPEFLADGDRLVQVFLNLGRNALESLPGGEGEIGFSTRLRLDHRSDVGSGKRVPTVEIDVEDSGCGIPEEIRHEVGTPFFTTKTRGTGLGLALTRHFVGLHGGTLQLETRESGGTRARVSLPLRRSA